MIVLLGYDGNDFIVHEPGTRFGSQYRYPQDVLMNAIHDLTSPETNASSGPRAMVVIE